MSSTEGCDSVADRNDLDKKALKSDCVYYRD